MHRNRGLINEIHKNENECSTWMNKHLKIEISIVSYPFSYNPNIKYPILADIAGIKFGKMEIRNEMIFRRLSKS